MWSSIWSVLTARIGFWTWIWSTRNFGLGQEVACWFQYRKNSTGFTWLVWHWCYWFENGWVCSWRKIIFYDAGIDFLFYIGSGLLKLPPRKLDPWFVLGSFFLLSLLCSSRNPPYAHAWSTVVKSGLVPLVTTWICWISYENGYAALLVLDLLPLLNSDSSSKCSQLKSFLQILFGQCSSKLA